jgi:protein-tyrosine phosphatase
MNGEIILTDSQGRSRSYEAREGQAEVYNLLAGETYSWQVSVGAMQSGVRQLTVSDTLPRILFVEGLSNFRDIGGYTATDGRRIRQGLLFRSSEADTNQSITPRGIKELTDSLGVRTDIDLRGVNGETVRAGFPSDRISHYTFPLAAYGEIFTASQKELYRQSFELLARESIYPAVVHCAAGMDRAGCWLFILGALIGIDEGDLVLDYELSSFSYWGARRRESADFQLFLQQLHQYGSSAQSASEGFLLDCGVTADSLERIRRIFTEN